MIIEITEVTQLGTQEIKQYTYDYEWKSREHEDAMGGEPPEYDPMELYGKHTKKELPPAICNSSYSIKAKSEESHEGDIVSFNNLFDMVDVGNELLLTKPYLLGATDLCVGDEIEVLLIGNAWRESSL